MRTLNINGSIVDDGDSWVYDWFDIPYSSPQSVSDFLSEAGGEDIKLSINSGGGSVYAGSSIYTQLMNYSGQVTAEVTGLCASIASVIMLAADKVSVSPASTIMIHNVWSMTQGDYQEHEHQAEVLKDMSNSIAQMYAKRTGMSVEEAQAAMDKETYYTADQAVEAGLADEKLFEEEEKAPLQLVASVSPMLSSQKISELKDLIQEKNESESKELGNLTYKVTLDDSDIDNKLSKMEAKIDSIQVKYDKLGDNKIRLYSGNELIDEIDEEKEENNSADKPSKNQLKNFIFGGK